MSLATQPKQKNHSPSHHKRVGSHQPRTKHFVKTYWPYLPAFAILVVGIAWFIS